MIKVKDYPDLVKVRGTVINTNVDEYAQALARSKKVKRMQTLEKRVCDMENKLDLIIKLLGNT